MSLEQSKKEFLYYHRALLMRNSLSPIHTKSTHILEPPSFIGHSMLKNEPTTLHFTDFSFFSRKRFINKKNIWKNVTGSPAVEPKLALIRKGFVNYKVSTFFVLEIFIGDILRRMSI